MVLQVLAPPDLTPLAGGEVRLVDVEESGHVRPAYLGAQTLGAYRASLSAYRRELEAFCHQLSCDYFLLSAADSLEQTIFETLRQGVFLK